MAVIQEIDINIMERLVIYNARVITPEGVRDDSSVVIEGGLISSVTTGAGSHSQGSAPQSPPSSGIRTAGHSQISSPQGVPYSSAKAAAGSVIAGSSVSAIQTVIANDRILLLIFVIFVFPPFIFVCLLIHNSL